MQALVYSFIGLTGLGAAAIAYFGLTFSVIEAFTTGLSVAAICLLLFERKLRRRSEDELTRRIEDLSKLLSTDAQAGQMLSQRVNELTKINAGQRLTDIEADMSVLGTVIQQVAESVADLEKFQSKLETRIGAPIQNAAAATEEKWKLTAIDVERAVRDNRIECLIQKCITLPQRQTAAYDVTPRINLASGEFARVSDIAPGRARDAAIQSIEKIARERAFALAKQATTAEADETIYVGMSRVTLSDPILVDDVAEMLGASTSAAKKMSFIIPEQEWRQLSAMERTALGAIVEKGAAISIDTPSSLRLNFPELAQAGVTSVRADAARFVEEPGSYSEFHSSDIAGYIKRYDVELLITGVRNEQQLLSVIEDGVKFATGNHLGAPALIPDVMFAPGASAKPAFKASSWGS